METPKPPSLSPTARLAVDLGPLLVFFVANAKQGIYVATGAFMVASLVAIAVSWKVEKRVSPIALLTLAVVLVFGGLTIWLHDERFIKLKPTIVYGLLATILVVGLFLGKSFMKVLLGSMVALTDEGWRQLTLRWLGFFVFMAVLNEIVWRNTSTDTWVKVKTFGAIPLLLGFSLLQGPLLERHRLVPASERPDDRGGA
jgi:intracellular septation protein